MPRQKLIFFIFLSAVILSINYAYALEESGCTTFYDIDGNPIFVDCGNSTSSEEENFTEKFNVLNDLITNLGQSINSILASIQDIITRLDKTESRLNSNEERLNALEKANVNNNNLYL